MKIADSHNYFKSSPQANEGRMAFIRALSVSALNKLRKYLFYGILINFQSSFIMKLIMWRPATTKKTGQN
jgi:hypothetical protein